MMYEPNNSVSLDDYFERMNKFMEIYDDFVFTNVSKKKSKNIKSKLKDVLLAFAENVDYRDE